MSNPLVDYLRCPDEFVRFYLEGELSGDPGYFQFAPDAICYGQYFHGTPAKDLGGFLPDASQTAKFGADGLSLPFDLAQVVDNLRLERYCADLSRPSQGAERATVASKVYYSARPFMAVRVRKHLQRLHLRGWDKISFPHWPVDFTVELLFERLLALSLNGGRHEKIPFIWFWPNGAPSVAMMTHDIEQAAGKDYCGQLMDLDDSFGIKSAFQIVPELRYETTKKSFDEFRDRGFEANLHDLNHDGALFGQKDEFIRRAQRINSYAKEFDAHGFRAGAMYRRQDWYQEFDLSYDMSVPSVAHLEPQRGGCCTVMPYFIGSILELPLTAIQDYSLFHVLNDYSIKLWKKQIKTIMSRHGLVSFIVHPDYIIEKRAAAVYTELLEHLAILRENAGLWIALPGEINAWWRNRNEMKLAKNGDSWQIEGPDSKRARLAFASLKNGKVAFELAP